MWRGSRDEEVARKSRAHVFCCLEGGGAPISAAERLDDDVVAVHALREAGSLPAG